MGCGEGVFLEAAGRVLESAEHASSAEIIAALTGIERDQVRAQATRDHLSECFGGESSQWDVRISDALQLDETERFDFVIGNPPWVRAHHLSAKARARYRRQFRAATGNFDLSFLFVEKALRFLRPGGELALIVSGGIGVQPTASRLRELLARHERWEITLIASDGFRPPASISPALLRCRAQPSRPLRRGVSRKHASSPSSERTLGDIATIRAGVATGANDVFILTADDAQHHGIERSRLRPIVRGRTLQRGAACPEMLLWPYELAGDRWTLVSLDEFPGTASYLSRHRATLASRPRLARDLARQPTEWYRFISLPPPGASRRFAVSDVFRHPAWTALNDPATVVMNTAFEVTPKAGHGREVRQALQSDAFWATLAQRSRSIQGSYRRTSATELRACPLPVRP